MNKVRVQETNRLPQIRCRTRLITMEEPVDVKVGRPKTWAIEMLLALMPWQLNASDAMATASAYATDELLERLLQTPLFLVPTTFAELGLSGFTQASSDSGSNIELRSDPLVTRDGTKLAFVAYRVSPNDRTRINFLYVEMSGNSCYPLANLQDRYELQLFIAPPNPHSGSIVDSVNQNLYRAAYTGGELMVKSDGTLRRCVVSLHRSRY